MRPVMDEARVMMILEARVAPENWDVLEQGYRDRVAQGFPAELIEIVLVQAVAEPAVWRIVSIWSSQEALDAYRRSVHPLSGPEMFRAAGADPAVSICRIIA
jgi:quinol monooxygenase YgiN